MPRWVWILGLALLAFPAFAQSSFPAAPDSGETATAPPQLLRAAPPPPDASAKELEARGDELRAQKSYADAIDYYRAALAKTGSSSAVLYNKTGIAQLMMLHYDQAKKAFERSIKSDPTYAEAYNNLGVTHYIKGDFKKAIRRYQKALLLREGSASFHSNLGTAYFARKQYDKASGEYLRALELDPDIFERESASGVSARLPTPGERARFSYVIAKMYAKNGNADRCLLYLRRALEAGYAGISDVYKDEEFTQVRKDPRFTELMASKPVAVTN
jgi:tetratricopeptide (TPR) repeat protein